jgi:hypothetical protein
MLKKVNQGNRTYKENAVIESIKKITAHRNRNIKDITRIITFRGDSLQTARVLEIMTDSGRFEQLIGKVLFLDNNNYICVRK